MGAMCHHAIIVTSWDAEKLHNAHMKAIEIGCSVSAVTPGVTNGYRSFLVAPDGSKEGWGESDRGDQQRAQLIDYLNSHRYDDGSNALNWVEVAFADDYGKPRITNSDEHDQPEPRATRT